MKWFHFNNAFQLILTTSYLFMIFIYGHCWRFRSDSLAPTWPSFSTSRTVYVWWIIIHVTLFTRIESLPPTHFTSATHLQRQRALGKKFRKLGRYNFKMAPGSQNRMNSNKECLKMTSGAQRTTCRRTNRIYKRGRTTWGGRFSGILRKIFFKNGANRISLDSLHH